MKTRTNSLQEIRPELDLDKNYSLDVEIFQNQTLRPILKFQHKLLIVHYHSLIKQNKRSYKNKTALEKKNLIKELVKMPGQRMFSLALIIGLFTVEEYKVYLLNSREFSKRIISMLIERVVDGLDKLDSF